jgi:surface protein
MGIIAASRLRGTGISPFIIEVDTSKPGSASDAFEFTGALGDYDVVAKQGGSVVQTFNNLSDEETITFSGGSGVYVLEITPKYTNGFNRINFNDGGDKLKLINLNKYGDIKWSSFENSFNGCSNCPFLSTDLPDLSNVTSMSRMFRDASIFNTNNINSWDVSNVTDMSLMFVRATSFNKSLNNWNVSNVTDMNRMFFNATSFDNILDSWNVSNVTDMEFLFYNASSANPDVSNWDVSNVTNMRSMFHNASSANPDVSNWDVSNVTDMNAMFFSASSANPDTSNWDVSSVTRMNSMFATTSSANPDTTNWDVSNVTNMRYMFENSNLSVEKLTSIYENWSQLNLQQNVSFSAGTTKYNASGQAGRDILVNTYNWTITDGGLV